MNVFTVQIHYLSLSCVHFIVLIKMNVFNERVLLNAFMHNTAYNLTIQKLTQNIFANKGVCGHAHLPQREVTPANMI